jgi:gluconolactonase
MLLRTISTLIAAHLAAFATSLSAQEEKVDLAKVPLPAGLLAPEAATSVAARVALLEGPAFDEVGNLFFSDIYASRIYRMTPEGKVTIFRADSGRTNGNTFDALGRLISCEGAEQGPGGRRQIVRTNLKTGAIEVLTDRYEGKRYNSPNDVVVDVRGSIWFSDPFYGDDRSELEMDAEAVYRIDADGKVIRVLSQPAIQRPNGLVLAPDGKTLYVVDSNGRPGGNRKIWAFDVSEDRKPGHQRLVFDFGRGRGGDGLRLDERGNLWVAAGIMFPRNAGETAEVPPGIYVITPKGELLGRIPIPEDLCTNLAFGGPDRKTLFVTAGKSIYKVPLAVSGQALHPPTEPRSDSKQ